MMLERSSRSSKSAIAPLALTKPLTTGKNPRINDFYGILESVAWIWRLLGIFPITIKHPKGMKKYDFNKFYAVYNFLIFATCVGSFAYSMKEFANYFSVNTNIVKITALIRMIASLVCMIFNNLWRIVRFKELSESIDKLSEQEIIMKKMGCRFNYESTTRIIRAYIWTTFVVILIFMTFDFYAALRSSYAFSMTWLLWMLPLVAQTMDLTILVSLVGWLGIKFRFINDRIRIVAKRANASSPKFIVTSNVCAENLRALSKAHYNLCAIGKRINRIFDYDVIINVTTAFIILSTTLYYIYYEVQHEENPNMIRIFSYIHWEFYYSAPIIVIVIICNWTSAQGIYAGKLIHEIRVTKTDCRLYETVKSFSLQLHHQRLEFTAGGFFPLDSSLLQTMVGTITTYLVILIQFEPKLDY